MIIIIKYDEAILQEIINNIDLLEYAEQTLIFEKRGKDYFTACPRHIDLSPSLSITPSINSFYCFSCGKGGTIINWLMLYENLTFSEAVQKASELASVDLSTMCQSQTVKFLRQVNRSIQQSVVFEHEILDRSILQQYKKSEITEWLAEGIPQDILDLYEVMIDEKSNRIVYPVYNLQGELINIKARTRFTEYKKMHLQKYINYYKVGCLDYFQGLNISINDVLKCGEIIIFESIKSVMKLRSNDVKNSASAEKHSLTDEQISLLLKLKVNIVLAYDKDVTFADIKEDVDKLKRFTNVYVMMDKEGLLGGKDSKNSPIDCGYEIYQKMYENKKKII